jgi:hypothetical protein
MTMLMQILAHTPKWVYATFFGLVWLGIRQMGSGQVGALRVSLVALSMGALSLAGMISAFDGTAAHLLAWAVAAALVAFIVLRRPLPSGTRYDAATRSFHVVGSALPLALMMGIFFTKYVVGVLQVMQPQLVHQAAFATAICALYGAFAGAFAARSLRLWKLALGTGAAPVRAAIAD